ncbi:MAG: septal ring lytic transglycosylase RlpA family protein [Spirulinaceae cyanobacterium SM2_1_0]|nr:septal ring lytic transglycosylase RlpA family protein [Spirulinaceae cyanobacterium SM2_1_0]
MKHRLLSSLAVTLVATGMSTVGTRPAEASETTARAWIDSHQTVASRPQESVSPTLVLADADASEVNAAVTRQQTVRAAATRESAIATIYHHPEDGKIAVTLFVRSLPVLTFWGDPVTATDDKATTPRRLGFLDPTAVLAGEVEGIGTTDTDPAQRAAVAAARLNEIDFSDFDAEAITAVWDAEQEAYVIKVADDTLVVVDQQTRLADSTRNWEQDVLQATNRLRRWLGNAEPLVMSELTTRPGARRAAYAPTVAVGSPARLYQSGMASWYGPGFHGRRSASGERFNQNALTAAHRTLPFGTQVRVTNVNNGRSVVVRINDRGPFVGGRVIDLSRAAASSIGMLGSGVAPVRVEVLGR